MNQEIALFYIPVPSKEVAQEIACDLIEKKLIICANIVASNSFFHWNDNLTNKDEILLLIKTVTENINPVREYIEANHPYETPLIAHYLMQVNKKYYDWAKDQLIKR